MAIFSLSSRSSRLLSVSPTVVEGIEIGGEEPRFETAFSRFVSLADHDGAEALGEAVSDQLAGANWAGFPVVVIFPSKEVTFRRLEFPFSDPKKIEQALEFELENELLEAVDSYVYDFTLIPQPDGSAEALIYLVPKTYLNALITACYAQRTTPVKATFSAQALFASHPPSSRRHVQVYLGPDECFASIIRDHQVRNVATFRFNLAAFAGQETAQGGESPRELLAPLQQNRDDGETGETELAEKMRVELGTVCADISQFLQSITMGEDFSLSLHGLFGTFIEWQPERKKFAVKPELIVDGALGRRYFYGVLDELVAAPRTVTGTQGVNFHRQRIGLFTQAQEFARPLAFMAALLVGLLGILGVGLLTSIGTQRATLAAINGEISGHLRRHLPGSPLPAAGVRMLERRLAQRSKDQAGSVRFGDYDYDMLQLLQTLSQFFGEYPELTMETLKFNADQFAISGTTTSYNTTESFKNRLALLPRFSGTQPAVTHHRTTNKITYRIVINR